LVERQACPEAGYSLCPGYSGCCSSGGYCCISGGVVAYCCSGGTCGSIFGTCNSGGGDDGGSSGTTVSSNPAPTFSSTTLTDGEPSATFETGNPQPSLVSSPSIDNLHQLLKCKPCGSRQCSFSVNSNLSSAVFSLIVGTPVTNCDGSTTPIKDTSTGTISIEETWSIDTTVGLALGGLHLGVSYGWSQAQTISFEQSIGITVLPGQMGVLVAHVQYQRTSGTMKIGSSDAFPLISNEPVDVVSFGAEIVPCDSEFSANTSSSSNCTSSAQEWHRGKSPPMEYLILTIVTVSFMTSLFR